MPDTVLGLVVLLTSLGPGFVYMQVAERREARTPRSGLLEAVELILLGAAASTITVVAVSLVASVLTPLDVRALARQPDAYYHEHPLLVIGLGATALAAAYPVAWLVARLTFRSKPVTNAPGSAWFRMLSSARPSTDHGVYATLELRDGRKIAGTIASFTLDEDNPNREIALWEPVVQLPGQLRPARLGLTDRFLLIREADVLAISGQYYAASAVGAAEPPRQRRKLGARILPGRVHKGDDPHS
jgi:Family of unknown function (DUF6338)